MITGSNLFGLAVISRSRLTQFSKLIYSKVVSKALLHNLLSVELSGDDEISTFQHWSIFEDFFW